MAMFIKNAMPLQRRRSKASKENIEKKKSEEAFAARMRKVQEIQNKHFNKNKRAAVDEPATSVSFPSTVENSVMQERRQDVENTKQQEEESTYSKQDLETLLFDLSDTPEKEYLNKTRIAAPGKQPNLELQQSPQVSYSKEVLGKLLWDMSDTPEKHELLRNKRSAAASVEHQISNGLKQQPKTVLYSKESLEAMLCDMAYTPEKHELSSKYTTSVGSAKRKLDSRFEQQPQQPNKKMKTI